METRGGLSSEDFQKAKNSEELLALLGENNPTYKKLKKTILYDE